MATQVETAAVQIEKLTKRYGALQAVQALDLEIGPGEAFGFLGPNGAGKTTTIRMLTGLTRPTSGSVMVAGYDLQRQPGPAKALMGVVQQYFSLDQELTVWEAMELHGRLRGLDRSERRQRIGELLDYVELADQAPRKIGDLSEGTKRRLMIARALMHRPRLLVLDEPTIGLDAQTRRRLWDLVRRLNGNGTTVFLTTHYIEEAETLCQRVGIIDQGRLIALGTPATLRGRLGAVAVETLTDNGTSYHYFAGIAAARQFAQAAVTTARSLIIRDSNLEDVFVELTGRKVTE